jgi:hypothetical protein
MESFRNATPDMFVAVINRLMDVPSLTPEQGQQCIESVRATPLNIDILRNCLCCVRTGGSAHLIIDFP